MRPHLECAPCLLKWIYERSGVSTSEEKRFQLIRDLLEKLTQEFYSSANVGLISNIITDSLSIYLSESAKYYEGMKLKSNRMAAELLPIAKNFIEEGETPREQLVRACGLAAASNVAPIGLPSDAFTFPEVALILGGENLLPLVMGDFDGAVLNGSRILYIADNAGEIGFDSLLITKLREIGSKVTLVVKEEPFFDDATMRDALFFNLDHEVDDILITNGFFVPRVSKPPLVEAFERSDLIIAKGTGNYESLEDEAHGKKRIYMLKIKCQPIGRKVGASEGNFVIKIGE